MTDKKSLVHRILRIELANEKHSRAPPPSDVDWEVESKLIVLGGNKLCAYQNHVGRVFEMWVLIEEEEDDDDSESRQVKWTKLMSIEYWEQVQSVISMAPLMLLTPLHFRRNGEVLSRMRKNGGLCLYNPKQKIFKWFEILENIKD